MHPQDLKFIMSQGLLSFPVTDFDAQGDFNAKSYTDRLEWLVPDGASALFAAGGTGEYFSLFGPEYSAMVKTAVETVRGKVPTIAGAGGPTRMAIAHAQEAERLGAHGVLLLPHYLTESGQEGLIAHVEAVCKSVKFGVIVYNRNVCKLNAESLAMLADHCPNLIGFKDGVGDIETMFTIYMKLGDRFSYLGGCLPQRSMPQLIKRWAPRCIRLRCSTSFPKRPRTFTRLWPQTDLKPADMEKLDALIKSPGPSNRKSKGHGMPQHFDNLIAGTWTPGVSYTPNINPSNLSEVLGDYAQASAEQLDAAVQAARAAFPAWSVSGIQARADALDKIGTEILACREELGTLLAREEGKTMPSVRPGMGVEVTREPMGVVGLIIPWNFPIAIPAWKIAPALAYGNCVVFKPADLVPGCAWPLAEIISRGGIPAGVFNLVMGSGSFTGSQSVGGRIAQQCVVNLKKVQLEMGASRPATARASRACARRSSSRPSRRRTH